MDISRKHDDEKIELHPRNKNRKRYDLAAMTKVLPSLRHYVKPNKQGVDSIDFSNPKAVKSLNQAILKFYYGIEYWEFPDGNLCPPIPSRAEYIHHLADLLSADQGGQIPVGPQIRCLDIGTGASCIYPIIGLTEYQWRFVGSDIDQNSIASAKTILGSNSLLKGKIQLKLQPQPKYIFEGIIEAEDRFELTICNPPFHASVEEALRGSRRKVRNLTGKKTKSPKLNFGGNKHELVYKGGEYQFIQNMIEESRTFSTNCLWFSSLVSKDANLKKLRKTLERYNPAEIKVMKIKTGNKIARILAWTFIKQKDRKIWLAAKMYT